MRTEVQQTAGSSSPRRLIKRAIGIIVSPIATLGDVARDPRPFPMVFFASAITAMGPAIFLSTDVGKLAWLDEAVRQAEAFGLTISDAQYAQLVRMKENATYLVLAQNLVGLPLVMMALAGIIKAVFMVAGAHAAFRPTLGVVAVSAVILALRQLLVLPLNYVRESMTSITHFGILLPMLPDGSFLASFLDTIDLFAVWWLLVLANGLGRLYQRPVRPIATTLFVLYGLIALGIALVLTLTGGG